MSKKSSKISLYDRCLNGIERVGNSLPHPIALFAILALAVILLSAVCAAFDVSATGELVSGGELKETTVSVVSLLTRDGLTYMFTNAVSNFTSYAPLGTVLVAMLGVGVAEQSGMIGALLKRLVKAAPAKLLTPMIVFLGVMSNIASDAGYVILIPLGAIMFRASGRHPIAGLAAAFAGVSGGYAANLLIGSLDPMLAGISQTVRLCFGGFLVFQRTLINSLVIFDADGLCFCPIGQEKAHTALSTAIVQNYIVFANQATVRQTLQHTVRCRFVGVMVFVSVGFIPTSGLDPERCIPCFFVIRHSS